MKPDPDLLRRIMLDVANSTEPQLMKLTYPELDDRVVNWHVNHLIECGFLKGVSLPHQGEILDVANISVTTPEGYAFVKILESDTAWQNFKKYAAKAATAAIPASATAILEYLKNYLSST